MKKNQSPSGPWVQLWKDKREKCSYAKADTRGREQIGQGENRGGQV